MGYGTPFEARNTTEAPLALERGDRRSGTRLSHGPRIAIGDRVVGEGLPAFVIGEIGINHNGSLDVALALVDAAADAGCDAIKLQKRTPELCVPRDQWLVERDTPWGRITYIEYRQRMELSHTQHLAIAERCHERGILWFASCWDEEAVAFIERLAPPCHKVASASLTDHGLLHALRATDRPIIMSTGMSTLDEVDAAVRSAGVDRLLIAHTNSTYPCPPELLNLRTIETLRRRFPSCPIGYSGHEAGIVTSIAAVALGATFVERHITLDRTMWGSDHAASLEPADLKALVQGIREIEAALGDGIKRRYDSELPAMRKLRRVLTQNAAG